MSSTATPGLGDVIGPLDVTAMAHGGHCVARHDGRVIFVRHTAPGEIVSARITDQRKDAFWLADAVEVHHAHPGRVAPGCPVSGPGGCGGCDFQHLDPATQRELKTAVLAEQLRRLAGYEWKGSVQLVTPTAHWRNRVRYWMGPDGPAMRKHHSHDLVTLPEQGCAISAAEIRPVEAPTGAEVQRVQAGRSGLTLVDGQLQQGRKVISHQAAGRSWRVAADGFWQSHVQAADTLSRTVLELLDPTAGERAFDLYCGVGLFAGVLADRGLKVWGVESNAAAMKQAAVNVPDAQLLRGPVERMMKRLPRRADVVVLDPPRKGAGGAVIRAISDRSPRAIAYVACDPSAIGRDLGTARELGWQVAEIRAFDLFPQTHHIEAVALLRKA